jgi:hypothetical protein
MGFLNSANYDDDDFLATAQANGTTEPPTPSWSSGLATAPFRGVVSAAEKLGNTVGALQSMAPQLPDEDAGPLLFSEQAGTAGNPFQDYSNAAPEVAKKIGDSLDKFANPPAATQGDGARMVQGFTEAASLATTGAALGGPVGAAALLGGTEGHGTYADMRAQGIDQDTAVQEGLLSGVANAAGAFIPMRMVGSGIVQSLLTGAGVNTVLGAANRAATGAVLRDHGYDQMASQYKVFDWNAAVSDAVLGAAFGGFGKLVDHGEPINPKEILPSDIDQAQVIQSEQHVTRDGAIGIPTDPSTEALHAATAQDSIQDLIVRGQVPDIQADHAEALAKDLVPDPRKDEASPPAVDSSFREEMPGIENEVADPVLRSDVDLASSEREQSTTANPLADLSDTTIQQVGDLGAGRYLREGMVHPDDWQKLKDAGLVDDIPNPDGTTSPGVDTGVLSAERERRFNAERANRKSVTNAEKARGTELRADNYARAAVEQEGEFGDPEQAKTLRAKEAELRANAAKLRATPDQADADTVKAQATPAPEPATPAPTTFTTAKGSTYTLHDDGTTTRDKAARSDVGHEGDSGVKTRSSKTVYVDDDASRLSAAGLHGLGEKGARVVIKDGKATLLTWNERAGKWGASPSNRDIAVHDEPAVGLHPLELWKPADDVPGYEAYRGMHAGNKITELRPSPRDAEVQSQERGGPQVSSLHDEMLSQLEARHGATPIDFGNGKTGTIADLRQVLADNGVQVQKDSQLHDVAAACFARGL